MLKFMIGAYLYDEVYEYLIGRRPALDPLGIINDTVGDLTGYELPNLVELGVGAVGGDMTSFQVEKKGLYEAGTSVATSVLEELPFVGGLLGGGRLPISSAMPSLKNLGNAIDWTNEQSGKKRAVTIATEIAKPLLYLAPPFGGGQAKKLAEEGYTVIQTTHHPEQSYLYSDRILALQNGRVVANEKPAAVLTSDMMKQLYDVSVDVISLYDDTARVCIPAKFAK
jgi:hypothetical protein